MDTTFGRCLLMGKCDATELGRTKMMEALGFRYATLAEVVKAQEAATPGSVNQWTPNRPIQPRDLPGKVNEYGFDTKHDPTDFPRHWWVIKEQE